MAARQTSIAFATAPPAPALTANVGIESATSTTPVVVPFHHLDQYSLTITSSLARAVRVSPQLKPKQLHCVRVFQGVANRLVTATIPYLLIRLGIASLSRNLVSRALGHSFAFSSASCPGDILSGGSLGLANTNSATAIATPASFLLYSSALRVPRSFSLVLLVHLASLLILSTVSGTFSTARIVCSAASSARVSGYAPLQRI